jgi:exopolysaccharide biosynthesis protein
MSRIAGATTILALIALGASCALAATNKWTCTPHITKRIPDAGSPIIWSKNTCVGETEYGVYKNTVNIVEANMAHPAFFATPARAQTPLGLAPVTQIMAQDKDADDLYVGINGGYFYRLDVKNFFDDVCLGKTAADARMPVNVSNPVGGIGDGLMIRDGELLSTNCNKPGFNRPAVIVLNGTQSDIVVQHSADPPPAGAMNAMAGGPNMVSEFPNGTSYLNVCNVMDKVRDEDLNCLEIAANTAVGIRRADNRLFLVTFDGTDNCGITNHSCGINVFPVGTFMLSYLNVTKAMGMDQGGSTTLVVRGQGKNGVVTCASEPNCDGSERPVFNGLFLGLRNWTKMNKQ